MKRTITINNVPYRGNLDDSTSNIVLASADESSFLNVMFESKFGNRGSICLHVDAAMALRDALLEVYPLEGVAPVVARTTASVKRNWIVAVTDNSGAPRPSAEPKVCVSEKQARYLAHKLAEENPGHTFAVYEKMGEAISQAKSVYRAA